MRSLTLLSLTLSFAALSPLAFACPGGNEVALRFQNDSWATINKSYFEDGSALLIPAPGVSVEKVKLLEGTLCDQNCGETVKIPYDQIHGGQIYQVRLKKGQQELSFRVASALDEIARGFDCGEEVGPVKEYVGQPSLN